MVFYGSCYMPFTDQVMALLSLLGTLRPDLRWHRNYLTLPVMSVRKKEIPAMALTDCLCSSLEMTSQVASAKHRPPELVTSLKVASI